MVQEAEKRRKHILVYYPPNNRSIAMETICKVVHEAGHKVTLLTLSERGPIHDTIGQIGIPTAAYHQPRKPSWKYFLYHTRYLIRFCRENKVDTIWSHFPETNVIAMLAQRYLKAKVFVFRHHDESAFYAQYGKQFGMVRNKREILIDKVINRFAKKIVVLSHHVLNTMKVYEKCDEKKIIVCPLIYDFSRYALPDREVVEKIRSEMQCRLLLIMVGRLIGSKQHLPVFEIVQKLITEGLSIKMIVMDEGPLRPVLENFVRENDLSRDIIMPGYSTDLINYMAASDLLMHPSLTEASSNVVKEMGFLEKPVAVCEGVGDFDDYIKANVNGCIMQRSDLKPSIERVIREAYAQKDQLEKMGKRLRDDVLHLFSDTMANREKYLKLI
jgi:glycosyltransferase involved in cell wall biosynthesis